MAGVSAETKAATGDCLILGRIATSLDLDLDDVKNVIAVIKAPKNEAARRNHAMCMAQACSPMREGQLGRGGMVLWRMGFVEQVGAEGVEFLLKLRDLIERKDEGLLADEILRTWEEYA